MDGDALANVEHQRQELEKQVSSLRKALRHWQTWEIEYEGLKEEILTLPKQSTGDDLFKAAQDFKAELVDDNEVKSLLGLSTGKPRTQQQVADLISRRVDYVSRNSETILKQLTEAEKKRNALLLAEDPHHQEDAGLPLTEITEELDEEGNVLSSSTNTPAGNAPQLLEVLKKAGVKEVLESDGMVKAVRDAPVQNEGSAVEEKVNAKAISGPEKGGKLLGPELRNEKSGASSEKETAKVAPLTQGSTDGIPVKNELFEAQVPDDEPEDDAALRREMIDYQSGVEEVGAIVAELELEANNQSDFDSYDEDLDEDSFDDTESNESEDEYGRSKKSPFTDKYIRQMLALEEKLGAKSMQNLGPSPDLPEDVKEELDKSTPVTGEPTIEQEAAIVHSVLFDDMKAKVKEPKKKSKKKVAFAEDLDIASSSNTNASEQPFSAKLAPPQEPSKKLSRFKKDRLAAESGPTPSASATTPLSSSSRPLSDSVLERPTPMNPRAPSPSEIDERMHAQEIATEYHQLRSRMIHRQGGFAEEREEQQEKVPLEEGMGGKKLSRFKAARLKEASK